MPVQSLSLGDEMEAPGFGGAAVMKAQQPVVVYHASGVPAVALGESAPETGPVVVRTDSMPKQWWKDNPRFFGFLVCASIGISIWLIVVAAQGGFSTYEYCKPLGANATNTATNTTLAGPKCRQVRGSKRTGRYGGGGSCFTPGTLIMLENERKRIDLLEVGDRLKGGGLVLATMKLARDEEPLYDIGGVVVSSTHTVRDPSDGVWRHAKNVKSAKLSPRSDPMLYNLITETHRVMVSIPDAEGDSNSPEIPAMLETADFMERDDTDLDLAANLRELNGVA